MQLIKKGDALWCDQWTVGVVTTACQVTAREDENLHQGVPHVTVEDREGHLQYHPVALFQPVVDQTPARYFRKRDDDVVACTQQEWTAWRAATETTRFVRTWKRPFTVVTEFTGRCTDPALPDPPMVYETSILQNDTPTEYHVTTATDAAAGRQHAEAVALAHRLRDEMKLIEIDEATLAAIARIRTRATLSPVNPAARDNKLATPQQRRMYRDQMRLQSLLVQAHGRRLHVEYAHEVHRGNVWKRHLTISVAFLEQEASPAEQQLLLELFSFAGTLDNGIDSKIAIEGDPSRRVTHLVEAMSKVANLPFA